MCIWRKPQRLTSRLFVWLFFIASGGYLFQLLFVVNTTQSFPPGLYRKIYAMPQKGDVVLFCPPDIPIFREALQRRYLAYGLCPAGTGYMIKRIVGTAGDSFSISEQGVSINGHFLPMSARRIHMEHAVTPLARALKREEVLLMSPHPLSFDGRYIGPLKMEYFQTSQQLTTIVPVYTWEE